LEKKTGYNGGGEQGLGRKTKPKNEKKKKGGCGNPKPESPFKISSAIRGIGEKENAAADVLGFAD